MQPSISDQVLCSDALVEHNYTPTAAPVEAPMRAGHNARQQMLWKTSYRAAIWFLALMRNITGSEA